jgi:hypothetical protein
MGNLLHEVPRLHVEAYFRALVPDYTAAAVRSFGTDLFLRLVDGQPQGVRGAGGNASFSWSER